MVNKKFEIIFENAIHLKIIIGNGFSLISGFMKILYSPENPLALIVKDTPCTNSNHMKIPPLV